MMDNFQRRENHPTGFVIFTGRLADTTKSITIMTWKNAIIPGTMCIITERGIQIDRHSSI